MVRRPVSGGPVPGEAVGNVVVIGRTYNPATGEQTNVLYEDGLVLEYEGLWRAVAQA
mgnify:CR=1 FL=1